MDPKFALGGPKLISKIGRVASRSHRGSPRGPRAQTMRPKFSIFGVFLALPIKKGFSTPHYYPKYEVWAKDFFW